MTKTFFSAAAVAVVFAAVAGGCGGNGAKEAGPVPTAQGSHQQSSSTGGASASTSTSSSSESTGSTASTSSTPLCKDKTAAVKVDSQQGAAGTIMTTWQVTNASSSSCRSFGYPGMDFHAASGWLGAHVQRGGVDLINQAPAPVVLEPGQSLYFVSLWGDADTDSGPCTQFDRVKVTLPDNFSSARVGTKGCVDPGLVRVGPVTTSKPT